MAKNWYLVIISILILLGCTSTEKEYFSDGKLKYKVGVSNNNWHGRYEEYYNSGSLMIEQDWQNGSLHGVSRYYFESGELQKIDTFKMGKANGTSVEYYENGQVARIGKWRKGQPVGAQKFYNQDGIILEIDYYDSLGRPYDYEKYDESGKLRRDTKVGILVAERDTVDLGSEIRFKGYLTNNEYKVRMIVGLGFDTLHNIVLDTLDVLIPENGNDGNSFSFIPQKAGDLVLYGLLQDKMTISDDTLEVLSVPFSYKFHVKN